MALTDMRLCPIATLRYALLTVSNRLPGVWLSDRLVSGATRESGPWIPANEIKIRKVNICQLATVLFGNRSNFTARRACNQPPYHSYRSTLVLSIYDACVYICYICTEPYAGFFFHQGRSSSRTSFRRCTNTLGLPNQKP